MLNHNIDKTMDFEDKVIDLFPFEYDLCDIRDYADDIEYIRKELKIANIYTSHVICYQFWRWQSKNVDATWLMPSGYSIVAMANKLLET